MKTLELMTLEELKAWSPGKVDFQVIQEIADKIAAAFQPEKIILFGSYACGGATEHSDVDLLVIAESSEPPPVRSVPIYHLLRNYLVPIDVLVRTPEEMKKLENMPFSFLQTAYREGVTLYERKA